MTRLCTPVMCCAADKLGQGGHRRSSISRSLNMLRNDMGSSDVGTVPLEFPGRSHEYLTTTTANIARA